MGITLTATRKAEIIAEILAAQETENADPDAPGTETDPDAPGG